jgi:4-carboxymuconolactone decarboxylase
MPTEPSGVEKTIVQKAIVQKKIVQQTIVQQMIGDIAPKLAQITDDVLFGDVWERAGLVKRDRSLITVAALMAMNRLEQLPFHVGLALDNGVTREELVEEITQLAFYSGWPTAMSALAIAKKVFAEKA